jgi:DNA-binding response OmpR family regulator
VSRILIAEDEPRVASFLEKGLNASGHTSTTVEDGHIASLLARDDEFDLMILELGLPGWTASTCSKNSADAASISQSSC